MQHQQMGDLPPMQDFNLLALLEVLSYRLREQREVR